MPPRAAYRFSSAGSRPTSSRWPRSAPEQKVPPAPLMTAAPTCWSRSASSQAATNRPASSLFRAFLVAGAFRVMNATPSVISRSIMGWLLGWVAMGGRRVHQHPEQPPGGIGHPPIMPCLCVPVLSWILSRVGLRGESRVSFKIQVVIDAAEPVKLAEFWALALDYVLEPPP